MSGDFSRYPPHPHSVDRRVHHNHAIRHSGRFRPQSARIRQHPNHSQSHTQLRSGMRGSQSAVNTPKKILRAKPHSARMIRSASSTPGRRRNTERHSGNIGTKDVYNENFKVVIRVRPPLERELRSPFGYDTAVRVITESEVAIEESGDGMSGLVVSGGRHRFTFDRVYDQQSTQREVYELTAKNAVQSVLQGYNASIIAYGQTSAGKTYTMEGLGSVDGGANNDLAGIIPRSIDEIFSYIEQHASPTLRFLVHASYLQIYNENISDLLPSSSRSSDMDHHPSASSKGQSKKYMQIREDKNRGLYVEGLNEYVVRTPAEIYGMIQRGAKTRATSATKLNEISSRSHAIFTITVEQNELTYDDNSPEALVNNFKIGKLNLVDLAGSERVRVSGASGKRLEETKAINQSLSALGNVISALTERPNGSGLGGSGGNDRSSFVPYRNSKLSRILEDSLGGNCKTTMFGLISPAMEHFSESLSTLQFCHRAKSIKNTAIVNEDLNEKALLRKYEVELKRLRAQLAEKSKNVVDTRALIELEEQRNQAEADRATAMSHLEQLSGDLFKEKAEKERLKQKIAKMSGAMLAGQSSAHISRVEDLPEFREALIKEQQRFEKDYKERVEELERERQLIEEDKLQVEKYKVLLIKQRDIMIQLTKRLNERDQSILVLQNELDAYDSQQRLMEDVLDQKTAQLIRLQKVTLDRGGSGNASSSMIAANNNNDHQSQPQLSSDSELTSLKKKLEDSETKRRHAEYILSMSQVGPNVKQLQSQLNDILEKERSKVIGEMNERFRNQQHSNMNPQNTAAMKQSHMPLSQNVLLAKLFERTRSQTEE